MSETPQPSPSSTTPGSSPQSTARNNARRAARRKRLQQQRAALSGGSAPSQVSAAPKAASAKTTAPKAAPKGAVAAKTPTAKTRAVAPLTATSTPTAAAPKIAVQAPKTTAAVPKSTVAPKTPVAPEKTVVAPVKSVPAPENVPPIVKAATQPSPSMAPAFPMAVAPTATVPAPRRWGLWIALGVVGCCIAAVGGVAGTYVAWRGSSQIIPNAFIAGEPVGGLTRHAARERLLARYGDSRITVRTPDDEYDLSLRELGGKLDVNRAVNDAYWFGRSGSLWQNVPRVLRARFDERHMNLPVRWDKEALKTRMRAVAKEFGRPAHDALLKVDGNGVHIVPEEAGRALNVGETLARLQRRYHVGLSAIDATVREVAPRLASADLEGTDVKLEQYTTTFNRGLVGRTCNIRVASSTIDGKVLLPGQTFSFNASTGERTADKGYRMAHIFQRQPGEAEAEVVDGLAGGTCQVSSTLFNAIRKSNQKVDGKLKIVQREVHSLPVTYVPRGLDATVAWPNRDFKFRNTLPHPIYLRTAMNGSRLTVSVWARVPAGNQLLAKNTIED